ncbi:MAG TPA: SGNH/GDSL hydrolase family protein, partial [Microlunatus sp.]|nr:SGNH/GDSL hydrolase family protein [Microlunatus sp.]
MRSRIVGAVLVVAALAAAGVVAVLLGGSAPVTAPGPAPVDYVALGDSFSAGPLVPEARSDPAGCFRSTNNYPAYLAGYL